MKVINVQLKYFAQLADTLGLEQETLEIPEKVDSIQALKNVLSERGPSWQSALSDKSTKCAVNQTIANDTTPIKDNAEIAFFPPVTGG